MSSIIAFLNAVGPNIGGLDMGDLSHLESIPERDRFFSLVSITSPGRKLTIPIPAGRKFIMVSVTIGAATAANSSSRSYVNLNFGGQKFDNLYYDYTVGSTTKIKQGSYSHFLTGDGTRSITVDVTSHAGVEGQVIILGYYASRVGADAQPVQDLTATELSPNDIELKWKAPLDSGGFPIVAYRIRRGDTVADDGTITNFVNLVDFEVSPQQNENELKYTDRNLQDRTTYYYRITTITRDATGTNRLGEPSAVVSATTEIDHPAQVTGVSATAIAAKTIRVSWAAVTDTGGVPLIGYEIIRSDTSATGPYIHITRNTNNLLTTYTDTDILPDLIYYYQIRAINADNKISLRYSETADAIAPYRQVTNIRSSVSSDGTSVQLFWDRPTDLPQNQIVGYRIQRSTDNITYENINLNTGSNRSNYTDNSVEGATTYYYRIRAFDPLLRLSPPSQPHTVTVPVHAPSSVQLRLTTISDSRISVSWTEPQHTGGSPITGFKLQRSKSIGFPDGSGDEQTLEKEETPNAVIDGSATVSDTITVSNAENFVIAAVEVDVNIAHVHRGDIEILLTAPDGQVFTLKTVDFSDAVDNIIETYSGEILNELIGRSTEGTWTLSVNDRFEPLDDGRWNSWAIRFIRATEALTEIEVPGGGSVRSYEDSGLDAETRYYYRIRASNAALDSDFSNIMNTVTAQSIFGDGRHGDLHVAEGVTHIVQGTLEFASITLENNAVLRCTDSIVKCLGSYTEIGSGHIEVPATGCAGGIGGVSIPGRREVCYSSRFIQNIVCDPATSGSLTPPTQAASCTSDTLVRSLINNVLDTNQFNTKFRNQIMGSKGSDGTAAAASGDGGSRGSLNDDHRQGGTRTYLEGGDGGQGAHGVDGVRGGGKFALIVKSIAANTIPTIIATGLDGIDGNQGTGTPGNSAERPVNQEVAGEDGTAASMFGTPGSAGSTGGIVYLIYENVASVIRIHDRFTHGTEGFTLTENIPSDDSVLTEQDNEMVLTINGSSGGTKLSKTYDLPDRGTNETVLSFDWQYIGNTNLGGANRFWFLLKDADTDATLYRERLGEPNISDSGRQTKSINITGILAARTSIKLEFETPEYIRTHFMVNRYFDNIIFEYPSASSPEIQDIRVNTSGINVSGGRGGLNGGTPSLHPLISRGATGPSGTLIEARLSDL